MRRCVDLADLLATAATGTARAVLLSADLRRLDRDALARLAVAGVAVVGLVPPGDEDAERRLRQLGVATVLPADASGPSEASAAAVVAGGRRVDGAAAGRPRARPPPAARLPPAGAEPAAEPGTGPGGRGLGADGGARAARPSRSGLAAELAGLGPADAAGRRRRATAAWSPRCSGCSTRRPAWRRPAGWPTPAALDVAGAGRPGPARRARRCGCSPASPGPTAGPSCARPRSRSCWRWRARWRAVTVVDCGFGLEQDEELAYDTVAPRRNGATLAVLEPADVVLAVGSADPVGLQRLVRGLAELRGGGARRRAAWSS